MKHSNLFSLTTLALTASMALAVFPVAVSAQEKKPKAAVKTPDKKLPPDVRIKRAVEDALLIYDGRNLALDCEVSVKDGVVTLKGFAENLPAKRIAVELAEARKGVRSVVDQLEVRPMKRRDKDIAYDLSGAFDLLLGTKKDPVEFEINDGVVRLTGDIGSFDMKDLAERTAESIVGVRAVANMLKIEPVEPRSDAEIRQHIDLALMNDPWIDSGLVRIDVKDGEVILSGLIDSLSEKRRLREAVGIPGVVKIDDSELEVKTDIALKKPMERQKKPTQRADKKIVESVEAAVSYDPRLRSSGVKISAQGGVVSLRGTVESLKARQALEENAWNTPGVSQVYNYTDIKPSEPISDKELAEALDALLRSDVLLAGADIEVASNDGRVDLYGEVETEFQRVRAETMASGASGVKTIRNHLRVDWPLPKAYQGTKAR